MDIQNKIDLLTIRVAEEFNSLVGDLGSLENLSTVDKSSLVSAVVELNSKINILESSSVINDTLVGSSNYTWSITKIKSHVDFIIEGLFTNVPIEHDTLKKISDDIKSVTVDLGNSVSYGVDTKTDLEKEQARTNIGAVSLEDLQTLQDEVTLLKADIGNLNRDFVSDFNNALI
jgi:hypothetical protein